MRKNFVMPSRIVNDRLIMNSKKVCNASEDIKQYKTGTDANGEYGTSASEVGRLEDPEEVSDEITGFPTGQKLASTPKVLDTEKRATSVFSAAVKLEPEQPNSESFELRQGTSFDLEQVFGKQTGAYNGATPMDELESCSEEPSAKKSKDNLGHAKASGSSSESAGGIQMRMPMCVRLVELYGKCQTFLRSFGHKKEDRKARHQMWSAIDARLEAEFGIHSGVDRLKKKIQNIQAGTRGKIGAVRRETQNGTRLQNTSVRFTPAEMEMVRTLYQSGDEVLNSLGDDGKPFYLQVEKLMCETTERRSTHCETATTAGSLANGVQNFSALINDSQSSGTQPLCSGDEPEYHEVKTELLVDDGQANLSSGDAVPSAFRAPLSSESDPYDTRFPVGRPAQNNESDFCDVPAKIRLNGEVQNDILDRQLLLLQRQEALQSRAELLVERQMMREEKFEEVIKTLSGAVRSVAKAAELLTAAVKLQKSQNIA